MRSSRGLSRDDRGGVAGRWGGGGGILAFL